MGSTDAARVRLLVVFACFFVAISAVPVLAAEATVEPPAEEAASLPDAEDVQEGIEMAEAEEAERERWLESPEAVQQREQSRFAFADLTAAEAQDLLQVIFAKQLETLNSDPARFLSEAEILKPLGQSVATVSDDGDTSLLDAGMPVRTTDDDGDLRKVDLSLEEKAGGFEPANPLTSLSIPGEAGGAIEIGDRGLAVTAVGAIEAREAVRYGEKNVFYPDVHGAEADTDQIVSPTSTGVEIFDLLRSADSPEVLRFRIDVPAGAELRSDGNGGAEVVAGEDRIASIPFPHATDAQGTLVPVDLRVEGDEIVLRVAHREADVAYPLLVDPAITEDWYNYNWFNGHNHQALENGSWQYTESHSWVEASTYCIYYCWGSRGLYVSMPSGAHWGSQYGHWSYATPNASSYLANAWASPFVRNDHSCSHHDYPEPHDYAGMWHNNAWNRVLNDTAIKYGSVNIESWGSVFILGLSTGSGSVDPCWRDLAAGGTAIWLDDWQYPSISSVTGIPGGWTSDANPITATVNSQDAGLGVRKVTIFPEGKAIVEDNVGGCTGLAAARCPTTRATQKTFTGDSLGEGIRTLQVSAEDPTGKGSATYQTYTRVDRTPPEVTLSGQLAQETNEGGSEEHPAGKGDELLLPTYNLKIEATDGSNAEDKAKRSGVKDIEVYLDGVEQEVPWSAQSCPASSCAMTQTYTLALANLTTAGKHTLEVDVKDQVGKVRERNLEFEYFPATGMRDEYVMHYFPLPDGEGNEAEEEHPSRPELAVNVMNGNLVYREQDVEAQGAAIDLEIERYYNSQVPEEENTEWGDGWSLAQTPDLELEDTEGSPAPDEAAIQDESGAFDGIELPEQASEESFDPTLQATIEKEPGGGYELSDETGESATTVAFDENGRTEELRTEGYAEVDYDYQAGELAEITVEDPAATELTPEELPEIEETPTYTAAFGSPGSGQGQFNQPSDIATDGKFVWVADTFNSRIQKFDLAGKFISQFGSQGNGSGQFNYPTGLALDAQGNIWVADASNHRLQQFSPAGAFLKAVGSKGSTGGKFKLPEGIAIDAKGNIWVADTNNSRVQKLNSAGEFIKAFGTQGEGPQQLVYPNSIDTGPGGHVWVTDRGNDKVLELNEAAEFVREFGDSGPGDHLEGPVSVEVDSRGEVWVADQDTEHVVQFDEAGEYVAEFGTQGSGQGQFGFAYPQGIATDATGNMWIADPGNTRVQEREIPDYLPAYASAFGSQGQGQGQFEHPSDIATDGEYLWVADTSANRIQKFDPGGKFISQFGSPGNSPGQLNYPSALELDAQGNIWVADASNHRIQQFSPAGAFLKAVGSKGSEGGKFKLPEGIAIDAKGNIWVADTNNSRVQKLNSAGEFIKAFGSFGTGPQQLASPNSIDTGPGGHVWVTDRANNKVLELNEAAEFVREFGAKGSSKGQFDMPTAIDVDSRGGVWVVDQNNDRIQQFNQTGEYVAQLGAEGTGKGQLGFYYPQGIASDPGGNLWIADPGNHRVQEWGKGAWIAEAEAELAVEDDPALEVEVSEGLVESLEGDEAGEHAYEHEGSLLTAHEGPQGETSYGYDEAGRMTRVELPNGTWGEIEYHADGRVKSVSVDPAGSEPEKTTYFGYTEEPRRTTVVLPDAPHVVYDIGEDGSVLKWWNALEPPLFDDMAGTLYDNREKPEALWPGDHTLDTQAHSEEGIVSIQVLANGNQLVDEETCEQDSEAPGIECKTVVNEWVTATEQHAPGHLNLEVLITDRLGQSASERFWVDIPQPPPPLAPGTPVAPRFKDVAELREEYGLEVVFPVKDEIELNERIFDLIGAWHNPHTPAGEVARASTEKWGVPLRPQDVAELEYRETYLAQAATTISEWGAANASAQYAGYYMDHRAGGVVRIGFTSQQDDKVASFISTAGFMAPSRVAPYPYKPEYSLEELNALQVDIAPTKAWHASIFGTVTRVGQDLKTNQVVVGATNVEQVESFLSGVYGSNAPIEVNQENFTQPMARYSESGRIQAGQHIRWENGAGDKWSKCTAGFGATERRGSQPGGQQIKAAFVLTAGHCFNVDWVIKRPGSDSDKTPSKIGKVTRRSFGLLQEEHETDVEAVRLEEENLAPKRVFVDDSHEPHITGVSRAYEGMRVCMSGAWSNQLSCGRLRGQAEEVYYAHDDGSFNGPMWQVAMIPDRNAIFSLGDSGAPVWQPSTGRAVGIYVNGPSPPTITTVLPPYLPERGGYPQYKKTSPGQAPGILAAPSMDDPAASTGKLHILTMP